MKRNYFRAHNKLSGGFTLAELLIVVAVIAVLVGISIPVFSTALAKAQAAACQANRRDLIAGYKVDYMLNDSEEDSAATLSAALAQLSVSTAPTRMSSTTFAISGLCRQGGVITAVCGANGSIFLQCDEHPDGSLADPSGAALQAGDFNAAVQRWVSNNAGIIDTKDKAKLYADYYASHTEVEMTEAYKQMLIKEGLNNSLYKPGVKQYWWTYPVTDGSGKLLYTVTYANNQSNADYWTSAADRGKMNPGYVVIVNGKTYMRTNSGSTVEPGNSDCPYKTEDQLEAALIAKSYKLLP